MKVYSIVKVGSSEPVAKPAAEEAKKDTKKKSK